MGAGKDEEASLKSMFAPKNQRIDEVWGGLLLNPDFFFFSYSSQGACFGSNQDTLAASHI